MRRQSEIFRLAVACVGLLVLAAAVSAQTVFINDSASDQDVNDDILTENSPPPTGSLPVLFVHGHAGFIGSLDSTPNYKKNWQNPLGGLPSFKDTLLQNPALNIEPYYIDLPETNGRSIDDDAAAISTAVDLILHRHNPGYAYPRTSTQTPAVQVVIIAYSKGTISTRKYLKTIDDLNQTANPVFRPVSEFIAIAPPNHGISTTLFALASGKSVKELYNGKKPHVETSRGTVLSRCTDSYNEGANYFPNLNGHPISDTINEPTQFYATEAPGSRPDKDAVGALVPPTAGTLYVTLVANSDANGARDFVGGLTPSTDCPAPDGRKLARNLASDAINIEVPEITGGSPADVHGNTVHTSQVICKALYAAVHHRSPSCAVCEATNGKPIIPPQVRASAMLVLDFSGSMRAPACTGCTTSRAEVLVNSVQEFLDVWSEFGEGNDRLGVTYFRTQVNQFHLPSTGEALPEFSAGHDAIITDLINPPQTAHDDTAMGGGLQLALAALRDPAVAAQVRRVILFTDGMQNVSPMVMTDASNQLVIADDSSHPSSGVVATSPPTVLERKLCIPIDTIGIGAGQAFVARLEDIANATGGRNWITTAPAAEVPRIFLEELIHAMRGFSPQLVAYRHGAIAVQGSTEEFDIEDGVSKLVLKVSWNRGESIDFKVAKDGVDVTSAGRFVNRPFYKLFVIDLPSKAGIAARGKWQLRLAGKAATRYETAAIVDDSPISYDGRFETKRARVGDPLDLVVRLTAHGKPFSNPANVTVTLLSPRTAVGDIIANIKAKELPAFERGTTTAEAQMLALMLDAKRSEALKPEVRTVALKATDKGDFRMQFKPQIPGVYTALVTIEGEDEKVGRFSRTMTVTVVVRLATAKAKTSDFVVSKTAAGGGWQYVSLVVSPRDKYGRLMGPGLASAISLQLSSGRQVGSTHDLGDGSYMLVLARPPGDDPTINLKVSGDELFSGKLSKLSGQ